jgi:hypothetical protein
MLKFSLPKIKLPDESLFSYVVDGLFTMLRPVEVVRFLDLFQSLLLCDLLGGQPSIDVIKFHIEE